MVKIARKREKKPTKPRKKCPHGKEKFYCRDCGGKGICEHQIQKSKCRDCGGSVFCKHKKQKARCIECGGSSLCIHGKQKASCNDCGGSSFCEHKKRKSNCRDCGGSSVCEHGKIKYTCRECNGSSFCIHKKQKPKCIECNGSVFCIHKKLKATCNECRNGSGWCTRHDKLKRICTEGSCGLKPSSSKCINLCGRTTQHRKNDSRYDMCAKCRKKMDQLECVRIEKQVKIWLIEQNINSSYSNQTIPCAANRLRPDFVFPQAEHVVVLEVDENQHRGYDTRCEIGRIQKIQMSVLPLNMHVIRYNPHSAAGDLKSELLAALKSGFANNFGSLQPDGCYIQYLGYSAERIQELEETTLEMQQEQENSFSSSSSTMLSF